jgi:Putative aminopeptidase
MILRSCAPLLSGMSILVIAATACSSKRPPTATPSFPRQELVADIKDFQKTLGGRDTKNFSRYSETPNAVYRCYFTGKLELPDSYASLGLRYSEQTHCPLDEDRYDVFFYPAEAVATGTAPVTPALAEASLERVLVVVPHEDFHNQAETRGSPPEVAEAAATLIGFLTASDFAKEKYGPGSQTFQGLDREAQLFSQKAKIVNGYYEKLSNLYSTLRARRITRQAALARKKQLFADLQQHCAAIAPDPVSFNKCPAAMNNAGLAFDRTYSRYYPMLFDFYRSLGQDTKSSIGSLKRVLAQWPKSGTNAEDPVSAPGLASP